MKFYPGDWLQDAALRTCSLAARGLWVDLLCVMHANAGRRGYLTLPTGMPMTSAHVARMVGISTHQADELFTELEQSGVFSRSETGAIFSRRMVRDDNTLRMNRENGAKGGNPSLRGGVNGGVNPPVNGGVKARSQKSDVRDQKSEGFLESLDSENPKHNQSRSSAPQRAKPRRDAARRIAWGPEGFSPIPPDMLAAWAKAYPACDITLELAKANAWLVANPKRVKSDYGRFLTSWLSRAQDRGGSQPYTKGNAIPQDIPF